MNRHHQPPPYISERIALEIHRREHLRDAPADCQCPFHVGREGLEKRLADKISRARAAIPPPPF